MAGDLAAIAAFYIHPLVVYQPEGIRIERTPEDTVHALADCLMNLRAGGAQTAHVRIDRIGPLQNARQPCDITWLFSDKNGGQVGTIQLRYFCRLQNGEVRIELIDIAENFQRCATRLSTLASH